MFTVVHAHADEKLRLSVFFERPTKVVIFQQPANRIFSVSRRDIFYFAYRNESAHYRKDTKTEADGKGDIPLVFPTGLDRAHFS